MRYIFTFGLGHKHGDRYQPVMAESYMAARDKMIKKHGRNWCAQHTEDEFNRARSTKGGKSIMGNLKPLKTI